MAESSHSDGRQGADGDGAPSLTVAQREGTLLRTGVFPLGYSTELLRWSDQREIAQLLVRAFAGDPLVAAICGPPDRRGQRRMYWSFLLSVRSHVLSPQPAYVVRGPQGAAAGVILVCRPTMDLQARSDVWFSLLGISRMGLETTRRSIEAARAIMRHSPPGPFTYVRTLAVDPAHQRRGLGSALLQKVFQESPPQWPTYLETARERNVAFYSQHGFQCIGTFRCLGVQIWRLRRPPQSGTPQKTPDTRRSASG